MSSEGPYGRHGFNANAGGYGSSGGATYSGGYAAPSYGGYGGTSYAAPSPQGYGAQYGPYGSQSSGEIEVRNTQNGNDACM